MNTEQTSQNIFTYIKTRFGETILAKIRKLEKTMTKYSSYTNHLVTLRNFFLSVSFMVSVKVGIFTLNMCGIIIYVAR